jgi:1-acyl-sn-glycerol-3-phosphate acyltransferase
MIYAITCFFLRILFRVLFKFKIYGLENMPVNSSFIITPNHVSHLDPIAAGAFVPKKLNYIAKKELFKNRFFGWYFKHLRIIPIDRGGSPYGGMKQIIKKIRRGRPIVIFPEGTRGEGDSFLEPEAGAAYLALKFNLPIVPAYIKGTDKALPKGAHWITLSPVRVYYGEPKTYAMPPGAQKDDVYKKVSREIMAEIKRLKEIHGA